jgi:hypothetical protein
MAVILDLDDLEQGGLTTPTDAVWGTPTGREVAISSTALLPDLGANVYFEVRDHPDAENNGLYRVNEADPTTSLITAFKISGVAPIADAVGRTVRIFGTAAAAKNVHFDTDNRDAYLLEEGLLSGDGATLQALYSFIKVEWKADPDLIKHPFPMIAITPEQFEFIDDWTPFDATALGPDATGFDFVDGGGGNDIIRNQFAAEDSWVILGFRVGDTIQMKNATNPANNGAHVILAISGASDEDAEIATGSLVADTGDVTATANGAIRTRKLIRTGGWSEVTETGSILARQYPGVISLGSFEDAANDIAYGTFANDPTDIGAAVDFDFPGPVNEAVLSYIEIGQSGTSYDFNNDSPDTIDLNGGGSFIDDGYQVGGQVTVRAATVSGNNGTYEITALTASLMTVQAQGGGDAGLTTDLLDTAAQLSVNNRNLFSPRLRIRDADTNGKTFDASNLAGIGITGFDDFNNRVFRFPLANATDLKISATDATIDGSSPWNTMAIRYFDQAFNREVDSATNRDFGIVVDVGTHSGVDGSFSAGLSVLTSAEGGIPTDATYTGGTLRIHEGTDENTVFTISGTPTATTVTITTTFTATESNISFTLQRATPVVATAEEIYEFVQRQLRLDADVDSTDQIVTGRTADEILRFVGDTLEAGQAIPTNPNGGGSGVIIEGFDSNDTNRLTFFDNTAAPRNFPFVAAGTINFNLNLQNDTGPAEYFMFFEYTERFTNTGFGLSAASADTATLDSSVTDLVAELADGDYIRLTGFADDADNGIFVLTGAPAGVGPWTAAVRKVDGETLVNEAAGASISLDKNPIDSPDAIIVNNNAGSPIEGTIGGASVAFDYDYDNNVQGGRTAATDADIVIRALGEDVAAFVEVFGTITRATGLSFSLVAPLERNFTNPV